MFDHAPHAPGVGHPVDPGRCGWDAAYIQQQQIAAAFAAQQVDMRRVPPGVGRTDGHASIGSVDGTDEARASLTLLRSHRR